MMTSEVELIVQDLLKSEEFQKGVKKMVEKALDQGIDASNIENLDSAVEDVINNGSFDAETTVSFSA